MPWTAAERQHRYRERLKKQNPEKYAESKRRNAERTNARRKKISETLPVEELRRKWREQKSKKGIAEPLPPDTPPPATPGAHVTIYNGADERGISPNDARPVARPYPLQQVDVRKTFSRESTSHCVLYGSGSTSLDPLKNEHPDILDEENGHGDAISVEDIKTEVVGEEETTLIENYDDVYSFGEYVASLLEKLPPHLCKTAEDDIVTLIKTAIDNYQTQEKNQNQTSVADHSYFNANEENVAIEDNSLLIDTPVSPSIFNVEENMMENDLCDDITDDEEYVNDDVIDNDENNLKRKYSDRNAAGKSKSSEKLELVGESLPELRQGKVARIPGTDTKNGDGGNTEEVNAVNTTLIENYDDIYCFGEYIASLLEKLPRQHCKTLQNDIVCLIKNVNVHTNKKSNTGSKATKENIGR